jgi:MYXO-CTERM domain-containing protein
MRFPRTLALLVPLIAATVTGARDASACGGCFVPPDANTQVTGHRMVLSVSPTATTLWDQITYSGAPESFAWVLPTKGVVDVGISSDLLFNTLAYLTDPAIVPPYLNCPFSCDYYGGFDGEGSAASGAGGASGGGVTVIAEQVVGPYETVQLSASDPAALETWLTDHGYNLPPDVAPVVDQYVNEGFNFLALKLVPGQGIDSMKPVRITTPGATPVLPLRMVAAGTGPITPITLWVVGEGRYEPSNFAPFVIRVDDVVWNWDTSESNYAQLKQQGLAANGGHTWLIESAEPTSQFNISGLIMPVVDNLPSQSGYGDANGMGASAEAMADLDALYGAIDAGSTWLTRMHGELPRAALGADLQVAASLDQTSVPHVYYVTKTTGTEPTCPADPCASGSSGTGGAGTGGGAADGGCAVGGTEGMPAGALGLALALGLSRWRRRR